MSSPAAPPPATTHALARIDALVDVISLIAATMSSLASVRIAPAAASGSISELTRESIDHGPRRVDVELHLAAEEAVGVEVAEHGRRIGDGRALAAAPVARRAGVGAGALWADPQQAARVDPGDRAAAGADRSHVDRGEAGEVAGERLAEPGLAGEHDARRRGPG